MSLPNTSANPSGTTQKHSGLFYISTALFDNKRLRQKRLRWAKALLAAAGFTAKRRSDPPQRLKRARRKSDLSTLKADVTIDLLSDDGADGDDAKQKTNKDIKEPAGFLTLTANDPPPLVPITNLHSTTAQQLSLPQQQPQMSQLYVCSGPAIEVSKVPNITLIPVHNLQNLTVATATVTPTPIAQVAPMPRRVKRKRKSQQPKRHQQPIIMNNESIVLSDDSDFEVKNVRLVKRQQPKPSPPRLKTLKPKPNGVITAPLKMATSAKPNKHAHESPLPEKTTSITPVIKSPPQSSPSTTYPTMLTPYSAQVDEEVTVSLVPRSSTAGNCKIASTCSNATELFPMLPDETTVHTVIANRTYELSLTKLREGLASCGMPEFSNGQQKITPTRRKGQVVDTPPKISPTPAPISLKLSSDLSISLISDDDDDNPEQQQLQRLAAESILQKQPQLMVQHVQLPPVEVLPSGASVAVVTAPRRRKLG